MFIVKFFGVMDFLAAFTIFLVAIDVAPIRIVIGFALYLFLKAFLFKGDFASMIDLVIGLFMILLFLIGLANGFLVILTIIAAVYLLQKAFFSFVSI